jgi:hypothetical protein
VEASYLYTDRQYDRLFASDVFGFPLPNTVAHFEQHGLEPAWQHVWTQAPEFRTIVKPFYFRNVDLAERYYSYTRCGLSGEAQLIWGRMKLRSTARWAAYQYDIQAVSQVNLLQLRTQEDYQYMERAEYRLLSKLTVFGEFVWERLRSNVKIDAYRSSTVFGGAEWEF